MSRCIPSGTTWFLRANGVWSLLTNHIRNGKAKKRLRDSLFPWRLWEENQVGFPVCHHHMFF